MPNCPRKYRQFRAPLDSLATVSCINPAQVELMGAVVNPIPEDEQQTIALAATGRSVKRVGRCMLQVRCGRHNVNHEFEILDMPFPILLGLDIFPHLGFWIGGVPTHWPGQDNEREAALAAATAENEMRRRATPFCLSNRDEDEAKRLQPLIDKQLQANAAIDRSQPACSSLPESIMHLKMPSNLGGSKTFRKQFMPPRAAEPAMDEAVETWCEHAVEPADPGSDFNTPLIAVGKKDIMGLKTAYRICMDLRHINALLASEGFSNGRVPKVDELLSRLEGFTHASTLDLSAAYNQLDYLRLQRRIGTSLPSRTRGGACNGSGGPSASLRRRHSSRR
jgi:hypothetical protein